MPQSTHEYDAIVVGAGFSGAVMAERMASQLNFKVLVLESRDHIAGNCYDKIDEHGIRIHQYGPHLFHTHHDTVWKYLSQFTEWLPYEHKVLGRIDGQLAPIPFNLNSLEVFYSPEQAIKLTELLIQYYGAGEKVPILELKKTRIPELQELADFIYNKLFVNYTCKQWGCKPEDISPDVTARVPVVISRDNRYFHDKFQALPEKGYTHLIDNILSHPNIDIRTDIDALTLINLDHEYKQVRIHDTDYSGYLIYTGMLDQLLNYRFGELPYRSLQFEFEHCQMDHYQAATTVNYPNEQEFTRITEFKHLMAPEEQRRAQGTTIVKEYPQDYNRHDACRNIPYYPVFTEENKQISHNYQVLLDSFKKVIVLGRLAQYQYFDMDDAVHNALNLFVSMKWLRT